jgi:predicted nucleotide-binding protein
LEDFLSVYDQIALLALYYNYFLKSPDGFYVLRKEFKKFKIVLLMSIIEGSLAFLAREGCIDGRRRLDDKWWNSPVRITSLGIRQFRLANRQKLKESKIIQGNKRLKNFLTALEKTFDQMDAQDTVFIVHGHDETPKLTLSNFLYGLGLKPIIPHDQPNKGRTIIEQFEQNASSVRYAFVLLTPDDVGSVKGAANLADNSNLKPRARQNVILELGFFMGKLGRDRVCCIRTEDVEIPSDYHGIVYLTYKQSIKECFHDISKELQNAGYNV